MTEKKNKNFHFPNFNYISVLSYKIRTQPRWGPIKVFWNLTHAYIQTYIYENQFELQWLCIRTAMLLKIVCIIDVAHYRWPCGRRHLFCWMMAANRFHCSLMISLLISFWKLLCFWICFCDFIQCLCVLLSP